MKNSSTIILLIYSFITLSQTKDSINTFSFDELTEKYYKYKFTDSLKAKFYVDIFLDKAKKEKDTINLIGGYGLLGQILKKDSIYINFIDALIKKTKPNKMFPTYAYIDKGNHNIIKELKNESLKNYLLAIDYASLYKNDSLKYISKQKIAMLKFRSNEISIAKKMFLEIYNFYNINPHYKDVDNYFSLVLNISNNYLKEKKYDSAIFFNRKTYKLAESIKDSLFMNYSQYRKGQIDYDQKKYSIAIHSFKKSLYWLNQDENYLILSKAYNFIAKSYENLKEKEKSFSFNIKIDSLYQKTNITHSSQKNSYAFLINYYKEKKDIKNQLKYIEKFLKVDSVLNSREKKLAKTFSEEYDKPKLLAEKEAIISQLENDISTFQKSKTYLLILLLITLLLFLYQYNKRKVQKTNFNKVITDLKNKKTILSITNENKFESTIIPKEIINDILNKLISFEKSKGFTKPSITLSILAKELNTNSNYLSKTINQYKGINFSTYLSKLRINYTLSLLEENEVIRKYTIAAIASEVGFKNAESFSKAFFKETKLKPSYYIKEIENKKIA